MCSFDHLFFDFGKMLNHFHESMRKREMRVRSTFIQDRGEDTNRFQVIKDKDFEKRASVFFFHTLERRKRI